MRAWLSGGISPRIFVQLFIAALALRELSISAAAIAENATLRDARVQTMERQISTLRADGWVETEATVISCKQTLGSRLSSGVVRSDGYDEPPEYTVLFRYIVADQAFTGKYQVHSEQTIGSTLTIAYDPLEPKRNTGTDLVYKPWVKIVAWTLAAGGVVLAIYFGLRLPDYYQPF